MPWLNHWWHRDILAADKLPLMLCFLAFVVTFAVTRTITRLIRDGKGPFTNQVTSSGTHVHHAVPGLIVGDRGRVHLGGGPGRWGGRPGDPSRRHLHWDPVLRVWQYVIGGRITPSVTSAESADAIG